MIPAIYDFSAIRAAREPLCDCHTYTNPHGEQYRVPPITDCPIHGGVGEREELTE